MNNDEYLADLNMRLAAAREGRGILGQINHAILMGEEGRTDGVGEGKQAQEGQQEVFEPVRVSRRERMKGRRRHKKTLRD